MSAPPLFLVACDRSGTTMLRLILDRSPDIAIPTESMIVVDFANQRGRYGDLDTDASFDRLAADVWRHPKVREWGLPGRPPARRGLAGDDAYRAALEAPFRAYAALHGKPAWGDKTPFYVEHLDEVKRVFPEARILILVRDGRDVALSLLNVPFGPANVWAAAHAWRSAIEAGERAQQRYADDVMTVHYEQLVSEPDQVVPRICAFAGIAYEPAMLAVEESAASRLAHGQEGWFRELYAGINANSVGKWRRSMSPSQQAVFSAVAGAALRRQGYDTPATGPPPRIPDAAWLAHNWTVKLWHFTVLHVVRERGREVPHLVRRRVAALRR
ncbi:MAG: sulfotransferase family protein [Gaiellales bacterium]